MSAFNFHRTIILLNISMIAWAILDSPVQDLLYHFQEYRLITFFSSFQLLATALLFFLVFDTSQINKSQPQSNSLEEQSHYVWLLMAIGFLYLSFDEVLLLHENLDFAIHRLYQLEESNWSDRIDDFIVLIYILFAALILFKYQKHLKHYRKNLKPYLFPGFVLLIAMFFLDLLTNRNDLINNHAIIQILSILEEIAKLAAEGIFLLMAYDCWKQTLLWQISEYKNQN